ncbi:alpha/beta fold hydrolase [Neobacillus vireti]|uniref:alpha/beta fold hydrolase n=1 Tax=Neobacillus vireti TaxID=220686 RepID=UPI00300038EB
MKKNTINLNGKSVCYNEKGKGSPIVLLHGFCGSNGYWDNILSKLSENYRVIALDLPGHGESANLEGDVSIEDIADHIKDVLDYLNVAQVTMFGHSLGGYIALAFAEKYSQMVNGFSLIHSTAYPDSEEAKKGREAGVEKVRQEGVPAFIDGLIPKLFSPDNIEKNQNEITTAKEIGYTTSPKGVMKTLIAMKNRPDRNSVLERAEIPVLLIAGEKDQIIPSEKTFSVSKSNIKHVLLKDSGHMSMYENPSELAKKMIEFLSTVK